MIGDADTLAPRPHPPAWVSGYAKGALVNVNVATRVTGLGYIYDSFNDTDDWVNVHNELTVDAFGNAYGPILGYNAARHRTQLLTDNCRAKVVLQSVAVANGESRVFICADPLMNNYYGGSILKTVTGSKLSIIRGTTSIAVEKFAETTATISPNDAIEVWYDRDNSTVRVFQNSTEICSQEFAAADIPHGAGARYCGVVMSCMKFLNGGPRFASFEATDVQRDTPVVHDPVDSLTPNPKWVVTANDLAVHRHPFAPNTLGPAFNLYTAAACRWQTEMNTASVKAVVTVKRVQTSGIARLAVRSNAAMTNWVGVEWHAMTGKVAIVKGTGPNQVDIPSGNTVQFDWIKSHQQWTVCWYEATKTLRVYRAGKVLPVLTWSAGSAFTPTGKYVGLSWFTTLLVGGVEFSSIDAYDITTATALPRA